MIDFKTVNKIDYLIKSKMFSSTAELQVFLLVAENTALTSNEAYKIIGGDSAYMRYLLSQLKIKGLLMSVDDKSDTTKNKLRRQIYSLSSKGSSLYRRIQDGAKSE